MSDESTRSRKRSVGFSRQEIRKIRNHLREAFLPLKIHHLSGPRRRMFSLEELVVVCLVRNAAHVLPDFVGHYRELGAKHIVLLDNGSVDGTTALVRDEPDITVFRTAASFKIYKDMMRRWLVTTFGRSNWVLCVDVDELFDYPFRNVVSITELLRYLNRNGFTAVLAQMLDLFPRSSIAEYQGPGWRSAHRFYNLNGITRVPYDVYYSGRKERNEAPLVGLEIMFGGVRKIAFDALPLITKHPLVLPPGGVQYLSSHLVDDARLADFSGVILHYKFAGDFPAYVRSIVKEESFWKRSTEYKQYLRALEENSELNLFTEGAQELSSVEQLVAQGFLVTSDAFVQEVQRISATINVH